MFEFINKETKKAYLLNEIDEIACKFWGLEIDPKYYAAPKGGANWFDVLGRAIEDLQHFHRHESDGSLHYHRALGKHLDNPLFEMEEVAPMILCLLTRWNKSTEDFYKDVNYLRPYVDFCFHLQSLGIVGVGRGW